MANPGGAIPAGARPGVDGPGTIATDPRTTASGKGSRRLGTSGHVVRPAHAGVRGWRTAFGALLVAQVISMVAFGMALPFLPLYVHRLGVGDDAGAVRWAGAMSTAGMLVMAVVAPFWGALADRHGRKPMVVRAAFGGGLIVGAMSLARTPIELFGLRTLQGAFSGTVAATRTLVVGIVPAAQLGFTLGLLQTAVFVGNSLGPLLGGVVVDAVGYEATFLVTGALLGVAGLIVVACVQERFVPPAPGGSDVARHGWRDAIDLLRDTPGLGAVIVTLFLVSTAQNAMGPVLPLFVQQLVDDADVPVASIAGLVIGIAAVTSAVAAVVAGRIGDRVGHGRLMAACAVAGGLLYVPQAWVTGPYELLAWRALVGLFTGGLMPGTMALVAMQTPERHRGWVFGLTTTATALGGAAGPIAGATAATTLGLRATFIVTGAILTVAGVWAGRKAWGDAGGGGAPD